MNYTDLPDEEKKDGAAARRYYGITDGEVQHLDRIFTYHPPKLDQLERYYKLQDAARNLAEMVMDYCPESREKSIALTKAEEAVLWANAAISRNE